MRSKAVIGLSLLGWLPVGQDSVPFEVTSKVFREQEAIRRRVAANITAKLTVVGTKGQSETLPEMRRRIRQIEASVCHMEAMWSDGKPVYETTDVARPCRDLISEFSGLPLERMFDLKGYQPSGRKGVRWVRKFGPAGTGCLESSEVELEADESTHHPTLLRVTGGAGCVDGPGMFRAGSQVEARYEQSDGVWQMVQLTETHPGGFEDYQVVSEIEFFFRTFPTTKRMVKPTLRIEKSFTGFKRMNEPRRLVLNPVEGELKPDADSSIQFDLDPLLVEEKPAPKRPAPPK